MSDANLIKQAYEKFIKNLFKNFYNAYTATEEKAAEQIFQSRAQCARSCYSDPPKMKLSYLMLSPSRL